jgi:hypothetical protein
MLMLLKVKRVVCSEIHTQHMNAMWAAFTIFEYYLLVVHKVTAAREKSTVTMPALLAVVAFVVWLCEKQQGCSSGFVISRR